MGITSLQASVQKVKELVLLAAVLRVPLNFPETQVAESAEHK